MKLLTQVEANSYLAPLDLKIGEWNEISNRNGFDIDHWINYKAPVLGRDLLNFCYNVVWWLPNSDWKLLQIDNSTYLDPSQKLILSRLFCGDGSDAFGEPGSYFIDLTQRKFAADSDRIILAHFVNLFLLFEGHCYIVASSGAPRQRLGIQDGFVYFIGADESLFGASALLEEYEKNSRILPDWVARMNLLPDSKAAETI